MVAITSAATLKEVLSVLAAVGSPWMWTVGRAVMLTSVSLPHCVTTHVLTPQEVSSVGVILDSCLMKMASLVQVYICPMATVDGVLCKLL